MFFVFNAGGKLNENIKMNNKPYIFYVQCQKLI